jgi:integrase
MLKLTKRTRNDKNGDPRTKYYITGTYKGERVRESLETDSRQEAAQRFERRRSEIVTALDAGTDRDITFATAAYAYIEAGRDVRFLDKIIIEMGEAKIADLTSGRVHDLARKIYPDAKASTRNRQVIAPALAVINFAADRKLCPALKIKRFKEVAAEKRAVTWEWVEKFQNASWSLGWPELGAMELFMFTTAARLGDAERLLWSNLDLEAKTAVLIDTKNGDSRTALLTDDVARTLRLMRGDEDGRVFGKWTRKAMYKRWKAICAHAGIEEVMPHEAGRHSFATEAIVRNGVDVATAAALGGWKSTKLLLDVYTHPENSRKVAETVFGKRGPGPKLIGTNLTPSIQKLNKS